LIPPGTLVSMLLRDVLLDEGIFEQPTEFRPERWLTKDKHHARCFVPFGKGSRMCLGLHLVMAELYLV
ncbi:cytochrome P450, partial [Setomelanomma holmii]